MNENLIEFYVRSFIDCKQKSDIDVSFIPAIQRRRLTDIDKSAVFVMNKALTEDTEYIVFSSQHGEAERLDKLITQYTTEKEVSPNVFSGSVHNYAAGFLLMNNKKPVPYNALASGDNSISMGLLSAIISKYDNVLFCYADNFDDKCISFAINISKNKTINADKYYIQMKRDNITKDDFREFVSLFSKEKDSLNTGLYKIVRQQS